MNRRRILLVLAFSTFGFAADHEAVPLAKETVQPTLGTPAFTFDCSDEVVVNANPGQYRNIYCKDAHGFVRAIGKLAQAVSSDANGGIAGKGPPATAPQPLANADAQEIEIIVLRAENVKLQADASAASASAAVQQFQQQYAVAKERVCKTAGIPLAECDLDINRTKEHPNFTVQRKTPEPEKK